MHACLFNDRAARLWLRRSALLAFVLVSMQAGAARAIVDVRGETWSLPASLPGRATVVFTADVSANDLTSGVHFALALREADGAPRALLRYATAAVANLPDAGESVQFRVVFDLECESTPGVVRGVAIESTARFCVAARGYMWSPLPGAPQSESSAVGGAFGLVVLDENGAAGANPTLADVLLCGGPTAAAALPPAAPAPQSHRIRILDGEASATIGIYFDTEGTQCQGTITPGAIDTVYVLAKLGAADDSYCGIAGAEFRFAGIPPSWHTSPVLHPDLLGIGDPFDEGVTVVSAMCRRPVNGVVLLFTVLVLADAAVPDVTFSIEGRQPPTNQLFPCPLVLACDDPVFTKVCVQAEPCFVNPTVPRKCAASTAVAPTTWSQLKALYR